MSLIKYVTLSALIIFSMGAQAAEVSLACNVDGSTRPIYVYVYENGAKGMLSFAVNGISGARVLLKVNSTQIEPIIDNRFSLMDGVKLKDGSTKAEFRVDGQDVFGQARLGILVTAGNNKIRLNTCAIRKAATTF